MILFINIFHHFSCYYFNLCSRLLPFDFLETSFFFTLGYELSFKPTFLRAGLKKSQNFGFWYDKTQKIQIKRHETVLFVVFLEMTYVIEVSFLF